MARRIRLFISRYFTYYSIILVGWGLSRGGRENVPRRHVRRSFVYWAVAVVPALAAIVVLLPGAKDTIKRRRPSCYLYVAYYNALHPWKSPEQVGNGKFATQIELGDPVGIAEDASGNLCVSDRARRLIWKIDPKGIARTIAGSGRRGVGLAGADALACDLGSPEGICSDTHGRIYIADSYSHVVLRIEETGALTRFAGTGMPGYAGDGGPATRARLHTPFDVRLDSKGTLFIADYANHRIRAVDPNGTIRTVAGTGRPGYAGDGGPAAAATLHGPYGVFVDRQDRLLIADSHNHVIRRLAPDGVITTIAGTGQTGYGGDAGIATAATFDTPQSLGVDSTGRIYVGDEHNHCIRVIAADGSIGTLLGNGVAGYRGDGMPAAHAQLNDPENILIRRDGSIVITDGDNGRVRVITTDGLVQTIAGRGKPPGPRP